MTPHSFAAAFLNSHVLLAEGALGRGLLGTIIIGLLIGFVAKFLTPGREPAGCIITMLIGIAGSVVALFIGQGLGFYQAGENPGFIASVIGAIILLVIYHAIFRPGSRGPGAGPTV